MNQQPDGTFGPRKKPGEITTSGQRRECRVKTADGRWRPVHRVMMEEILGRPLRSDEIVHHLNHDGTDNRPDNLVVLSRSRHAKVHLLSEDPARLPALRSRLRERWDAPGAKEAWATKMKTKWADPEYKRRVSLAIREGKRRAKAVML